MAEARRGRSPGAFAASCLLTLALVLPCGHQASAQTTPSSGGPEIRQSLDDAWWTGPMLTPSAATLPRGGWLIEPYLYDVTINGRYDEDGVRRPVSRVHGLGTLTYVLYGLADGLTVGLIPTAGFNQVSDGLDSSGIKLGDVSAQASYRLTRFRESSWIPATSLVVQETFPTGKYDRLGDRPSDAFGAGAYTTTLALYSQTYFWLANGRILRMRLDLARSFSTRVRVRDASVYGTADGFRGHAWPGGARAVNASWEYSLTRRWVLAFDAVYRHDRHTRVTGRATADAAGPEIRLESGSSTVVALAPAVEYSWSAKVGVLLGVRLIPAGRNTSASVTPAVAINAVWTR